MSAGKNMKWAMLKRQGNYKESISGSVNQLVWPPGIRSTVNGGPHPARLGRGLHHETNSPHTQADHPQAQNG